MGDDGSLGRALPLAIEQRLICKVSLGRALPLAIEQRLICKVASSLDNGGRWEAKSLGRALPLAIEQRAEAHLQGGFELR